MKKSLLVILGAALLMVGCTKELESTVNDLASRLENIEAQIAANKAAIEELQKASFISLVEENGDEGWIITLSTGKKYYLYNGKDGKDGQNGANGQNGQNGKDGKDGDSFFKSVTIEDGNVVLTLTDGTVITLPYIAEFAIVLDSDFVVPEAGSTVEIGFSIVGKTEATTVNTMAGGDYLSEIVGDKLVVTVPDPVRDGKVLIYADNGQGKTSIKTVEFGEQKVEVGKVSGLIPFWSGSVTFTVASNVAVTLKQDEASQKWLQVTKTKGMTTSEYTAKSLTGTPSMDPRYAYIDVLDPAGNKIETVTITQNGTGHPLFIEKSNKMYDTFAEAIAFAESDECADATVRISVMETSGSITTKDVCVIPATAKKNYVITKRGIGNADGSKCIFGGLEVTGNVWVNVFDVAIKADGSVTHVGSQFNGYGYSVVACKDSESHVTINGVTMYSTPEFVASSCTHIAVDAGSKAIVNVTNNTVDCGGARFAQIYGGDVTFSGNTISNSYGSYAIRVGCDGTKMTVTNNMVDNGTFVDLHSSLANATVTFGNGEVDDNHYSSKCTLVCKGTPAATVTVRPASVVGAAPGAGADKVMLNGYGFATIQGAVDFAKEGDVIEVSAGEYSEVVRVANSKKGFTIKGAGREATTIAGGIEISGGVTVKDLTIKSKPGVTTNELKVTVDGEGYAWGHYFLSRVENGASNVTFDNVHFDATDNSDDNFKGTMSMLWISQAQNVLVKNCVFDTAADASYCPNQTHAATVRFENNVFNGGGKKDWVLRAMDTDVMTVTGNEFHAGIAIDVYSDFKGSLTLGDGVADNNVYGSEVSKALNGDKDAAVAAGAVFAPADVVFNAPTTEEGEGFKSLWSCQMDVVGIADARNFTYDGTNVIACCTAASATPVAVRGGEVVANLAWDSSWTNGFTGCRTGMTAIKNNGKTNVLVCNVASIGNQWAPTNLEFDAYLYTDNNTVTKVLSYVFSEASAERVGDYLSFKGTWQDGEIIVSAANNTAKNAYVFAVKDGVVAQTPTLYAYDKACLTYIGEDGKTYNRKSGTSGLFHYKDDLYIQTNEGCAPAIVRRDEAKKTIEFVATFSVEAITGSASANLRTPHFFTLNGKEYMACVCGNYASSAFVNANVAIVPIEGGLEASLSAIDASKCYIYTTVAGAATSGNGFSGCDIYETGSEVYVGYGVRRGELGLLKFRNQ